ncbi:Poly-beta-1,6-N-acetyl-D-glucosamine N-deacetylase precursor [compost metagenome]
MAALRADDQRQAWTRLKSRALVDFTLELSARVRAIRGAGVLTARNIFAQPVLDPRAEEWFAENVDDFLGAYDWTAPMAMPLMEGVAYADAAPWLDRLVDAMRRRPGALDRTVFELQSMDWRTAHSGEAKAIDADVLASWMRRLKLRGALNFGYYPDDFIQDHPRLDAIRSQMTTAWLPAP